jgi:chromosome segregation ATPase
MKRKPISKSARYEDNQKNAGLRDPLKGAGSNAGKTLTPTVKKESISQIDLGSYNDTDIEIKSRERTLELLRDKMKDFDSEAIKQLEARDRRINDLNKQILELQATLKSRTSEGKDSKQKSKQISVLEEEVERLNNQLTSVKSSRDILKKEFETARRAWEEEKESLEMVQEGLMEEQEGFKTQIAKKCDEVNEVKKDIIELSKIISMMTGLNKDLNEKVETMNHEMETLNTKYFEAIAKAQHIDEIEASLKEYASAAQVNGANAIRYQKRLEKLENERNELGNASRAAVQTIQTALTSLQQTIAVINNLQPATLDSGKTAASNQLTDLHKELANIRREIAKNTPAERVISEPNGLNTDKSMMPESEQSSSELTKKIKAMERKEASLIAHLKSLEKFINARSSERDNSFDNLKRRLDAEISSNAQLKEKIDNLRRDIETKDVNLSKLQTKVINLTDRVEYYLNKAKADEQRFSTYEIEITDIKEKLMAYKKERLGFDKEIKAKERRIGQILKQVAIFQDELWRRDTESVRKAKELKAVEDKALELEEGNKKLHSEIKDRVTKEIEKFNSVMEEKDREINLLKEMLRGAQFYNKPKETDSSRSKRPEVPSPEPKSPIKASRAFTNIKHSTDGGTNTGLKPSQVLEIATKSENALTQAKTIILNLLNVMPKPSPPQKRTPRSPQEVASSLCTELNSILSSMDEDISLLKNSL